MQCRPDHVTFLDTFLFKVFIAFKALKYWPNLDLET
jgi:hypothetical protein